MRNDRSKFLKNSPHRFFAFLLLVASAVVSAPLTSNSQIHLRGLGELQIGMTIQEARTITGQNVARELSGGEERGCFMYRIAGLPGVSIMETAGRISRIDISDRSFKTISGIRVGDPQKSVFLKYPDRIKEEKEHYTQNPLLVFAPKDAGDQNFRIKFYCEEGTIRSITVGKIPEVNYIEGCL